MQCRISLRDIVNLGAVAAGNDAIFKLLRSRKIAKIATFWPLSPDRNFKFSRMLAIYIMQNSTKCRVNFEPLLSNWGPVNGWGSSKMVRLWTRVIWKRGCKSKNWNKCVSLRLFLTITARLRIRRPCIAAENGAPFFFSSRHGTKITTRATLSRLAQPAFNRGQPNYGRPIKYMHMSYVSVPIFVNFGLLSTKWKFFKLGWCLHRPHGKQPLYAHAFSLSCCCLKRLYAAGRPSRGTSVPHLLVTGSIARSATSRYLSYSEADFEVFRPAGATRCTDANI